MRLTSEQTKRIMECIAEEMGVELGDMVITGEGVGVVVDPGGFKSNNGWSTPATIWRDIIRGESFEKVPWEPKIGDVYFYPTPVWDDGTDQAVYYDNNMDQNLIKRVGVYRTEQEAIQKARELGWVE